jgi:hypothetical protein
MTKVKAELFAPKQPEMVRLEIPRDYADTLQTIFQHIGGPAEGRRGHVREMAEALDALGAKSYSQCLTHQYGNTIYFK